MEAKVTTILLAKRARKKVKAAKAAVQAS